LWQNLLSLWATGWIITTPWAGGAVAPPELKVRVSPPPGGPVRLDIASQPNGLFRIEASNDLGGWREIGRVHDGAFGFPDLEPPASLRRFYRVGFSDRVPADDWKNQLLFPDDTFSPPGEWNTVRWVKFAILT
jgi:hypothetical protein